MTETHPYGDTQPEYELHVQDAPDFKPTEYVKANARALGFHHFVCLEHRNDTSEDNFITFMRKIRDGGRVFKRWTAYISLDSIEGVNLLPQTNLIVCFSDQTDAVYAKMFL